MTNPLTAGMKTSEMIVTIISVGLGTWLASRGTTVDVLLAVMTPAMVFIGGRSAVKYGKEKANGGGKPV